ncbi:hypothetical protein TRVL_00880 [Trypanosoma vivax]|uniref:Glutathione S-transferase n=1 Tax=Trypanosoma vivax (strain Y486) TaxID=1055687 RepID=G0UCV5_TRYVY|nr:hypothetical protein TRVL_00880 [Trypanosoma vivax]CCC53665.1 conserved hypothetical protein [Trypanosoma vivax Y486]
MFRVLGSPYTLAFHQQVAYLRLKRMPFKVYCRTFTTTLFYAWLFRARNTFCTVTPDGKSYLQLWQLAAEVEKGTGKRSIQFVVRKDTHPNIHLSNWLVVLYSTWWLAKTGAMYRWFKGDSVDVIDGYLRYFFLAPGVGASRAVAKPFRQAMQKLTSVTGVSKDTAPYMQEHFMRLCEALEYHLRQLTRRSQNVRSDSPVPFLLGTPHPTLADVALGSVFSANFLMDDPPASLVLQKYPHLNRYLVKVTGWRGGVFVGDEEQSEVPSTASESIGGGNVQNNDANMTCCYSDDVPESLSGVLALIEEVMPFVLSQCTALQAYMAGDGVCRLKKEPLEEPWEGCSGYLLPQVTDIKSLMIIDNGVYTVCARAQDLEVALMAAREVVGDDVNDDDVAGNRHDNASEVVPPTVALTQNTGNSVAAGSSDATIEGRQEGKDSSLSFTKHQTPCGGGEGTRSPVLPMGAETVSSFSSSVAESCRQVAEGDNFALGPDPDFHRVFTLGSQRTRGILQPQHHHGQLARSPARDRLLRLRGMLKKMHYPHYTLASVFHGRKMFVAIIPEFEVTEKKKKMCEVNG